MGGVMVDRKVDMRSGIQVFDFGSWVEVQGGLRENQGVNLSVEDKGLGVKMFSELFLVFTVLLMVVMQLVFGSMWVDVMEDLGSGISCSLWFVFRFQMWIVSF